jgi:hypothetical protein
MGFYAKRVHSLGGNDTTLSTGIIKKYGKTQNDPPFRKVTTMYQYFPK